MKVFNFQLHSVEKIIEFNRTCESIFAHQKILEEEINKLSNLLERKKRMIDLKIFEEKWDWQLNS
ncbi:hypothetical protein WEN_02415 [Mycoplasma wenyonii str. Massachusetts]|uniref:Uncharacterized protein n=1 Tax=Mycoplasma wenyonii (strain Massachusetts) TaxID=1197325 RepID=I6ZJA9_MYCWM|nr:hypothetical protein WEN_02415 [Mycoplasma wenyonii str. Massachusetts]